MISTVLFDLDGTLIHMEQDAFLKAYFHHITAHFAAKGYDPELFFRSLYQSVGAMLKNDGKDYNNTLFWNTFASLYGKCVLQDTDEFERFYDTDYEALRRFCGPKQGALQALNTIRGMGLSTVLASNSVYPTVAYRKRAGWGNIDIDSFDLLTHYETMHYCKPSAGYFLEIADKLHVRPEECLMVGNDVSDDMPAKQVGMQVFLLTDYLLNPKNEKISHLPQGHFDELLEYIKVNQK